MIVAAIATMLFIVSIIFALIMISDDTILTDRSRAQTYAVAFIAVILVLNIPLLYIALKVSGKLKARVMNKCISCNSPMDAEEYSCPVCRAIQPRADESAYLKPDDNDEKTIRPKN